MSDEYGNDFVTLLSEDGNELEFEHIDTVEYNDDTYIALVPVYADPGEAVESCGELVI